MTDTFDIDYNRLPSHVAVIMDGNGRWAAAKGIPKLSGHKAGMEALKKIVRKSGEIGLEYLTVYAFSTENWKRSDEEVGGIFQILVYYMEREIKEIHKQNVKVNILGDYSVIPAKAEKAVRDAVELTKNNTGLQFNIALNYGGRDEITRAVKRIAEEIKSGKLSVDDIDESEVSARLFTAGMPDPDLIIRTSGELRLSNFLLWQSAYSEYYFTDCLWPDFDEAQYLGAISEYQNRKRNFGGR
ncbi:MAG: isoprenyl transferase [Bacillota bacterium]|nr:isoprenyl transferase [Bacillota bacterium]